MAELENSVIDKIFYAAPPFSPFRGAGLLVTLAATAGDDSDVDRETGQPAGHSTDPDVAELVADHAADRSPCHEQRSEHNHPRPAHHAPPP